MRIKKGYLPDRYQYISFISSGAFGDVLLVRDEARKKEVALKVLNVFSKRKAKTFNSEFIKLSTLNHPNLIKVYDYGFLHDGKPYFTMEYIEGKDLREFLRDENNLKHISEIISQILSALKYLHSKDILHGDIKPENIMVTSDNKIKLLDFGLVVRKGTRRSKISGTPGYIAPEVLRGEAYTESSDLYALGISLIESILKRRAYPESETLYKELSEKFSRAELQNASSLSSFIISLCSSDEEIRPNTTEQAILSLEISSTFKSKWSKVDFENIFVGREKELRYAENFLRRETDKHLLIIKGVTGSGKKTLTIRIITQAQLKRFLTVEIDAVENKSSPIRDIFEIIAQNLEKEVGIRLRKSVEQIYNAFKQKTDIVSGNLSDNYSVDLYIYLSKIIIEYSSKYPIILILKNIESFENDFLKFIIQLLQVLLVSSADSLLLICTLNNDRIVKANNYLNIIINHELTEIIDLKPLSKVEFKHLIEQTFNTSIFLDKEIDWIYDKTQGLPLLIKEFLIQIISKGMVVNDGTGWKRQFDTISDIKVFSSMDEVFIDMWKMLTRNTKRVLRIIAFYDSKIKIKDLVKLTGTSLQILNDLNQTGILTTDGEYISFINPIYKEYIRKNTPSRTRIKISTQIGLFLESSNRSDVIKIARYFLDSDLTDQAYKYALEAAKILISQNNLYLAYDYLRKLKKILQKNNKRKEIIKTYILLAELEELIGKLEKAIEQYNFIIEFCDDYTIKTVSLIKLADIEYLKKGNPKRSYILYRRAYRLASKIKDKKLIALSLTGLSESMPNTKKEKYLIKAANIARQVDINSYSIVLSKLIFYYWKIGKIQLAEKYLLKAIDITNNLSHTNKLSIYHTIWILKFYTSDYKFILNYFGNIYRKKAGNLSFVEKARLAEMYAGVYYTLAEYNKMIPLVEETIDIYNMQRAYYSLIIAMNNLLIAYKELADYSKCLSIIDKIELVIMKNNISHYYSINIVVKAKVYSILGEHFRDNLNKNISICKKIILKEKNPIFMAHYYLALLDNNYFNLKIKKALNYANNASSLFIKVKSRDDSCEALLKKSILLCELGEPGKARRYIKQAWNIYEQIHCEYLLPQLLLARGMVERLNNEDKAIESLREALKVSKKQLTREQTWQIQREMALYYRDKGQFKRALKYYKDAVETIKQITESIPTEEIKLSYLEVPFRKRVFDEIKELKKLIVK